MEVLQEAIKEASEGLGINASSLQTELLNAGLAARQEAAVAASGTAGDGSEQQGESPGDGDGDGGKKDAPQRGRGSAAVGPPAPPEGKKASGMEEEEEHFYHDDEDVDDAVDEQQFRRSGMYAEL
jgi:hypothetical protein